MPADCAHSNYPSASRGYFEIDAFGCSHLKGFVDYTWTVVLSERDIGGG